MIHTPYTYEGIEDQVIGEADMANIKRFLGDLIPEEGGAGTPQPATPAPSAAPGEPSNQLPQPLLRTDGGNGTPQPKTPAPSATPENPDNQLPQPEVRTDGGSGTPQPVTPQEAIDKIIDMLKQLRG